mmetsp:Transcript_5085/g.10450  ORF Transcript_5085/g.10450 Transcript_5085/m.10450 type:complete len:182 (-) Transcript_5085:126-671(-)
MCIQRINAFTNQPTFDIQTSCTCTIDDLIEDWPHRRKTTKRVHFSDAAVLRIYQNDEDYARNKSYTAKERKVFSRNALVEAARIRKIVATISNEMDDESMITRLESCGVAREEITGLEHLVLEKSPKNIVKARQMHVQSMMLEHEKQNIVGFKDENRLAFVSRSTSKRAVFRARIRASVAA